MLGSWERLKRAVQESERLVFFGGAGVSTESGIPDFRGTEGIYRKMPEEILSHDFFWKEPETFYRFYKQNLIFPNIQPNTVHHKLAEWEKTGKLLSIITQNIDGLHQLAGSQKVWELHGSVHRNFCTECSRFFSLEELLNLLERKKIPQCSCSGLIKPDVVLYGESLAANILKGAIRDLREADLCLVGGTSLSVYPAAGLLEEFSDKNRLFVINRDSLPEEKQKISGGTFILSSLGEVFQQFS